MTHKWLVIQKGWWTFLCEPLQFAIHTYQLSSYIQPCKGKRKYHQSSVTTVYSPFILF